MFEDLIEEAYQKALQEILDVGDGIQRCPKCNLGKRSPSRLCKCGHEFWHIFTRFELLKKETQ